MFVFGMLKTKISTPVSDKLVTLKKPKALIDSRLFYIMSL